MSRSGSGPPQIQGPRETAEIRLGLYVDAAFRSDGQRLYCGEDALGFMRFGCAVGKRFDGLTVIGRGTEDPTIAGRELPGGAILAPLPHYPSLRGLWRLLRVLPATVGAMWRALSRVNVVWISAPHPLGLILVMLARARGRRVVLLIRQDSPRYFRTRLPGRAWAPLLIPLRVLDWVSRGLARRLPTTVVGAELAQRYRSSRQNVLEIRVALIERDQLAEAPRLGGWTKPVQLLTVGRIEPEKDPLTLVEAIARLDQRHPGRFELTWVGEGRLSAAVLQRAAELGVASRVRLAGFVPFGDGLLELYRGCDAFIHTALTEGLPQVLPEAMGSGIPVVATDVGGVRAALEDGAAGLLVPPSDPRAIADAVEALSDDPALRERIAERGLELARTWTLEAESESVARFLGGSAAGPG